jgi:hypothetical protein
VPEREPLSLQEFGSGVCDHYFFRAVQPLISEVGKNTSVGTAPARVSVTKNLSQNLIAVGHSPLVYSVEPNSSAFRLMIPIRFGKGSKKVY